MGVLALYLGSEKLAANFPLRADDGQSLGQGDNRSGGVWTHRERSMFFNRFRAPHFGPSLNASWSSNFLCITQLSFCKAARAVAIAS